MKFAWTDIFKPKNKAEEITWSIFLKEVSNRNSYMSLTRLNNDSQFMRNSRFWGAEFENLTLVQWCLSFRNCHGPTFSLILDFYKSVFLVFQLNQNSNWKYTTEIYWLLVQNPKQLSSAYPKPSFSLSNRLMSPYLLWKVFNIVEWSIDFMMETFWRYWW